LGELEFCESAAVDGGDLPEFLIIGGDDDISGEDDWGRGGATFEGLAPDGVTGILCEELEFFGECIVDEDTFFGAVDFDGLEG
jgi:hypothetical protein